MKFRAVLLKALDDQFDRDGDRIDPAGVTFPSDVPITWEFDYNKPPLGVGTITRQPDGSLMIEGELNTPALDLSDHYAGVAVMVNKSIRLREGTMLATFSDLLHVGLVRRHPDPTQPVIEVIDR